jgi:hypothetical protein
LDYSKLSDFEFCDRLLKESLSFTSTRKAILQKANRYFISIGKKIFGENFRKNEDNKIIKSEDSDDSDQLSKASSGKPSTQLIVEQPTVELPNSKKIKKSNKDDDDKYGFSVGAETVNYMYQERSSSKYLIF